MARLQNQPLSLSFVRYELAASAAGLILVRLLRPSPSHDPSQGMASSLLTADPLDSPLGPDVLLQNDEEAVVCLHALHRSGFASPSCPSPPCVCELVHS